MVDVISIRIPQQLAGRHRARPELELDVHGLVAEAAGGVVAGHVVAPAEREERLLSAATVHGQDCFVLNAEHQADAGVAYEVFQSQGAAGLADALSVGRVQGHVGIFTNVFPGVVR